MARSRTTRRPSASRRPSGASTASTLAESAQEVWLAGLGALDRARTEGPRMFDSLVAQGRTLRQRAGEAADQALKSVREGAGTAGGRFGEIEKAFEERLARSLARLGVLTRGEVDDLARQVQELTDTVRELAAESGGAPARRAKPRRKAAAPRATVRRRKAGARKRPAARTKA